MENAEILNRCRLACGAEAVAMGYSCQAGYDIFEGIIENILAQPEDVFFSWIERLEDTHGAISESGYRFTDLFIRCHVIVGQYSDIT